MRQKHSGRGEEPSQRPTKKRKLEKPSGPNGGTAVDIDSLKWRTVELPDRMEDLEGFYGLEEVDEVDIVKKDDGQIEFKDLSAHDPTAVDEEWNGIQDDDIPSENITQESSTSMKKPKKQKKKQPKVVAAKNPFEALQEEAVRDLADVSAWGPLGLMPETLNAIATLGFTTPTPIQSSVIPLTMDGKDVIGKAPTGSGKTLAFGIPILEDFLRHPTKGETKSPVAFIVSPTRELAHQLDEHLRALYSAVVAADAPRIVTITGGLSQHKQIRLLEKADVIIGTPGRLWEVISQGHGLVRSLRTLRFLVLDEADRLLSEGHFKELEKILDILAEKGPVKGSEGDEEGDGEEESAEKEEEEEDLPTKQTLVFSATFSKNLQQKLTRKMTWNDNVLDNKQSMEYLLQKLSFAGRPSFVDINPVNQLAENLTETLIECGAQEKDLFLYYILLNNPNKKILVFTNSISAVRRIAPFLHNLNVPALPLHSQMIQKARLRSLERFKERSGVLVATDVAARGLDIPSVDLVVHYHLPRAADAYVHRSGRTARASNSGSSIIICSPDEVRPLNTLLTKLKTKIRTLDVDRSIVGRLKPRTILAKKLADATLAKEKVNSEDNFLKNAAEELGVDYSSDEEERERKRGRGRGKGREQREKQAATLTKAQMGAMKAELKSLLDKRVNAGVSERYLANGTVDVDALLKGQQGAFLGINI